MGCRRDIRSNISCHNIEGYIVTRFSIIKNGKGLAFGKDHAFGEYLQIWETLGKDDSVPDCSNILVDEDCMTGFFTRKKMLSLIQQHGFDEADLEKVYR